MPTNRRVLIFQLGEHHLAVSATDVQEIVLTAALVHSPGMPAILSGFLNLRGAAAPVIRLHRLFGLPLVEPELHTPLIVLRGPEGPVALQVDRAADVFELEDQALTPISADRSFNDCAEGTFHWEDHETVLLSAGRLLLWEERKRLTELQTSVQGYLDDLAAGAA